MIIEKYTKEEINKTITKERTALVDIINDLKNKKATFSLHKREYKHEYLLVAYTDVPIPLILNIKEKTIKKQNITNPDEVIDEELVDAIICNIKESQRKYLKQIEL